MDKLRGVFIDEPIEVFLDKLRGISIDELC